MPATARGVHSRGEPRGRWWPLPRTVALLAVAPHEGDSAGDRRPRSFRVLRLLPPRRTRVRAPPARSSRPRASAGFAPAPSWQRRSLTNADLHQQNKRGHDEEPGGSWAALLRWACKHGCCQKTAPTAQGIQPIGVERDALLVRLTRCAESLDQPTRALAHRDISQLRQVERDIANTPVAIRALDSRWHAIR